MLYKICAKCRFRVSLDSPFCRTCGSLEWVKADNPQGSNSSPSCSMSGPLERAEHAFGSFAQRSKELLGLLLLGPVAAFLLVRRTYRSIAETFRPYVEDSMTMSRAGLRHLHSSSMLHARSMIKIVSDATDKAVTGSKYFHELAGEIRVSDAFRRHLGVIRTWLNSYNPYGLIKH